MSDWEPFNFSSKKSPHLNKQEYFDSASIEILGELFSPGIKEVKSVKVKLFEDISESFSEQQDSTGFVGYISLRKDDRLLEFVFILSSELFSRIAVSLSTGKIDGFIVHGEKIKNDYSTIFDFSLSLM